MSIWKKLLEEEKLRWDVQSDEKLFNLIEAFAERIIEKSTKIQTDLSDLTKYTTGATIQLSCAFNELTNLASSQFVANIIPEITVEAAQPVEADQQNPVPAEKRNTTLSAARMEKIQSQEKREQTLLPKHQKAVQMALKGLKVEELMKDGASDDGVSLSSVGSQVFRGTLKKLPHIIGTSYFFHDPWIGLFEEDEQKLENNDEAFTTVFEAKDAPKMQESPMGTVGGPAYAPPMPPPMQKTAPPIPPPVSTPMQPPGSAPPNPPPPQKAPPPPPPPPPKTAPPAEVQPGGEFNNFQKGLAATLEHRKAIIDGDAKGDLSVKNILTDESKALGTPMPKPAPPPPPPPPPPKPISGPPAPPGAQQNPPLPPTLPKVEEVSTPNPDSYDEVPQTKRPEEMTLEDKRKQLAGIIGGGMMMRKPEPAKTSTEDPNPEYQAPPQTYQAPPQTYQAPPQNNPPPPPQPIASKPPPKQEEIRKTGQFLPNITEDEEIDTLFRPSNKPPAKDKKNYSGLFDLPPDDKPKKAEVKKTRAEGLFNFIKDDDEKDTADLLLNSDLAKQKLGKTTTENPFLFRTDPTPKKDPPPSVVTAKPAQSDDPLSGAFRLPSLPKDSSPKEQSPTKAPQLPISMPIIGGPPPKSDKTPEISNDLAMNKPVRTRAQKTITEDFGDFEDEEETKPKGGMFKPAGSNPFISAKPAPPKTAPPPVFADDPLMGGFVTAPKPQNNPLPKLGKGPKLDDDDDETFTDLKKNPPKSSPKDEKGKMRQSLFDDDDEELSFRPAKPAAKETGGRKNRGSLFDDD